MKYIITPIQIILNPPDVIIEDLGKKYINLIKSIYQVKYLKLEHYLIAFNFVVTEENKKVKYPSYFEWPPFIYSSMVFYPKTEEIKYYYVSNEFVKYDILCCFIPKRFHIEGVSVSFKIKSILKAIVFSELFEFNNLTDKKKLNLNDDNAPVIEYQTYVDAKDFGFYFLNQTRYNSIFNLNNKTKINPVKISIITISGFYLKAFLHIKGNDYYYFNIDNIVSSWKIRLIYTISNIDNYYQQSYVYGKILINDNQFDNLYKDGNLTIN